MLYNRALSLQRQGNNEQTEEAFRELLEHPFITEVKSFNLILIITIGHLGGIKLLQIYYLLNVLCAQVQCFELAVRDRNIFFVNSWNLINIQWLLIFLISWPIIAKISLLTVLILYIHMLIVLMRHLVCLFMNV